MGTGGVVESSECFKAMFQGLSFRNFGRFGCTYKLTAELCLKILHLTYLLTPLILGVGA